MLRFTWAGQSHVGHVRDNNEDSGFAGPYLLLVADGVGGAAAGEVASASTTYVASSMSMAEPTAELLDLLGAAVESSHRHLRDGVLADPSRAGMATTLTAVLCDGERFGLAHIGDSRTYLMRDGELVRLTRDHSLVQELVDAGSLAEEDARLHPHRSMVLRYIDGEHRPDPDLMWLDVREGDRLLLCSDGLSDLLEDAGIASLLDNPSLDQSVADLVDAALDAGGRDNITCVVADVVQNHLASNRLRPDGALLGAVRDVANLIDPAVRFDRPA